MKKQINLYQSSCYLKRDKVTFKQFLLLTGICLFFVLILQLILHKQFIDTKQGIEEHKILLKLKNNDLILMVTQLQKKRAPEIKTQQYQDLQAEVETKQSLLASLSGVNFGVSVSFPELMRGLSLAEINTIRINNFSIIDGRLNISGQAKHSDSVPLWLIKTQAIEELSSIAFEKFKITEKNKGFSFKLSNSVANKTLKESIQ